MRSEEFQFEKSKVIQALRFHFISRREIRFLIIAVNIFAVLSAFLFYWKKVTPLAFLMSSALWILLMLVFWFILPYVVYKKTQIFRGQFQADIDAGGLTLIHDRGENHWPWDQFSSWSESPHFFHYYFSEKAFFIIPKKAFPADNWEQIRQWGREKTGKGL